LIKIYRISLCKHSFNNEKKIIQGPSFKGKLSPQ